MAIVNLIFELISTVSSIAMGSAAVTEVIGLVISVVLNLVITFILYAIMVIKNGEIVKDNLDQN